MYVEDKASYNGPMPLVVNPGVTVANLKEIVQAEYEFPVGVQRWILDKTLADDDTATLTSLGINKNDQKIFLYLVAPGSLTPIPLKSNIDDYSLLSLYRNTRQAKET